MKISTINVRDYVLLGRRLRGEGDRAAALAAFEGALAIKPDDLSIQLDIATELTWLQRFTEVEALLQQLIERHPDQTGPLLLLGHCKRRQNDRRAALSSFENAASIDPTHPGIKIEIAKEMQELGRVEDAAKLLCSVIDQHPNNAGALIMLGHLQRKLGDQPASLAAFRAASTIDPGNLAVQLELVQEIRGAGQLDEAEQLACLLVEQHPKLSGPLLALAHVKRKRGDRTDSLTAFEAAAALDPAHLGIKVEIANDLRELGRTEEADAVLAQILGNDPKHVGALVSLGHLRRRLGKHSESIDAFMAASSLQPSNFGIRVEVINGLLEAGRLDEAASRIDTALSIDRDNFHVLIQRGLVLRRQQRRPDALQHLQRIAQLFPHLPRAHVEVAKEYIAQGDLDNANRSLSQAREIAPDDLSALLQSAELEIHTEDFEAAKRFYDLAIARHPNELAPWIGRARALFAQGEKTDAFAAVDAARQAFGDRSEFLGLEIELLKQTRDWVGAKHALTRAASCPPSFWLWTHRVQIALAIADYDTAEEALARATPSAPNELARVQILHGQLAESKFDYDEAIARYRNAIALNPLDSASRFLLARASLMNLDLDVARAQIAEMVRLTAATLVSRGLSLNPSQNQLGQLLDEYELNAAALNELRQSKHFPGAARLPLLRQILLAHPDYTPASIATLVALRLGGALTSQPGRSSTQASRQIPATIVQFWDRDRPDEISELMESWKHHNPGFTQICFDDDAARGFLRTHHPSEVLRAYVRARQPAQKADIFRLAYLSHCGGVYIDADDRCFAPIDELLTSGNELVLYQEDYGSLGNNFIAAIDHHPVLLRALAWATDAVNRGDNDLVWLSTGPGLLSRAFATVWAEQADWLANTTVLALGELQRKVGLHCPVRYKRTDKHWSRTSFGRNSRR